MSNEQSNDFQPRVAFDTFGNRQATDVSLTLRSKHSSYKYSRLSRTFLCGVDDNPYSKTAIKWLFEDLAEDGDEIVCLRVIDPGSKTSEEKRYRDDAQGFLNQILKANTLNRKVSLVLEFSVGKVQDMIQRMIQIYEPAILVVGTRGRSLDGFKGLLPGSVSKYCLQHSPVPVVVVRPSQKREKKRQKREQDPTRRRYKELLQVYSGNNEVVKIHSRGAIGNITEPDLPAYLTTPVESFKRLQSDSANASTSTFNSRESSPTRSSWRGFRRHSATPESNQTGRS